MNLTGSVVKARAPKERCVEVHIAGMASQKLTATQHAECLDHLEQIRRPFPAWNPWDQESRPMHDCRFRWRPSVKVQDRFKTIDLYQRTQQAVHALGQMGDLPMNIGGSGVVRIGNDLIKHIADELRWSPASCGRPMPASRWRCNHDLPRPCCGTLSASRALGCPRVADRH